MLLYGALGFAKSQLRNGRSVQTAREIVISHHNTIGTTAPLLPMPYARINKMNPETTDATALTMALIRKERSGAEALFLCASSRALLEAVSEWHLTSISRLSV
jgi:hypothetical protein